MTAQITICTFNNNFLVKVPFAIKTVLKKRLKVASGNQKQKNGLYQPNQRIEK